MLLIPFLDCGHSLEQQIIQDWSNIMQVTAVKRMQPLTSETNPVHGKVRWSPAKSLWWMFHFTLTILAVVYYFSWSSLVVFGVLTVLTICLGHTIGLHRLIIHRSFSTYKWLEYVLVHLGTLVGMGGPFDMLRLHDIRDWAQRHPKCHPFFIHKSPIWKDALWNLHCTIKLESPPRFTIEPEIRENRIYYLMQKTWMLQNLPLALLLYSTGGIGWVLWGISVRIIVSLFGHWCIGYFAHNIGERDYHLEGHSVQGQNLEHFGMLTMGECWHNNHHAYPESARLGHHPHQHDPGWWALLTLQRVGLVWDLKTPEHLPVRSEVTKLKGLPDQIVYEEFDPAVELPLAEN